MKWLLALGLTGCAFAGSAERITILFDSSGLPNLEREWGYAALVEHGGRRVLFDAGPSAPALAHNTKTLGIDPKNLDAVVVSHDDSDHIGGLGYLYSVNPGVGVYIPDEDYGPFGTSVFTPLVRAVQNLTPRKAVANPAPNARYVRVPVSRDLFPGMRLVLVAGNGIREQALVLQTPRGVVLLTGCAHPGVVSFLRAANTRVDMCAGGMYLIPASAAEIDRTISAMRAAGVSVVAPGHCTGDRAVGKLRSVFDVRCIAAGAGTVIPLTAAR